MLRDRHTEGHALLRVPDGLLERARGKTDGARGQYAPALRVDAVDSVGAGDAFNGGLAVALSEGRSLAEAIDWGMAAGALSVTRAGAQPSMPDRAAVVALLNYTSRTKNRAPSGRIENRL